MNKLVKISMVLAFSVTSLVSSAEDPITNGGLESLRGINELDETRKADPMKRILKDRAPVDRNYVHQPPVVPHKIRGYRVDLNSNKCLSCHGWKFAREVGATKISPTHFETREGMTLSDVSPRRYFCLQCHVPQANSSPQVENTFDPVDSIGNPGNYQ